MENELPKDNAFEESFDANTEDVDEIEDDDDTEEFEEDIEEELFKENPLKAIFIRLGEVKELLEND